MTEARNNGADPITLVIQIDGQEIGGGVIGPGARRRIDASAVLAAGPHTATFTAARPGWTVAALEIANVHGYSTAPFELVVVPRDRRTPGLPLVLVVVAFAALVALGAWPMPAPTRGKWPARIAGGLAILVMAAALIADRVSPFAILISVQTFVLLVVLLYVRRMLRAISEAWPIVRAGALTFGRNAAVRSASRTAIQLGKDLLPVLPHLALVGWLLYGVSGFYTPGVGFTRLILFGSQFAERSVPALQKIPHAVEQNGSGYDGQFYAQLAFDPFLRDPKTFEAVDSASYRGRRMLFPLTAFIAGLGHPPWVLQAYAVLNVVAWVAMALVLCAWLPPGSTRAFAAWVGCLLADGWTASIRASLTDGPSLLLIALSVLAIERARRLTGSGMFALAMLGRETSAFSGLILLPRRFTDLTLATVGRVIIAVAPFGLWILYLRSLGLTEIGASSNLGEPFGPLIDKWSTTIAELAEKGWSESYARISLVCLVGVSVQAIFVATRWRWQSAWWRIGIAHAVLMLFLGPSVLDGYPGAFTRALLPLAVAFNIELMRAGRLFWPLWILGNLAIVTSSELVHVPYWGSLI